MSRPFACADGQPVPQAVQDVPVFLHGMWRSGSTFIWSRFRANPATCCFYEPLHHGLDRLTSRRIGRDSAADMARNRHPTLERPYFAEFEPLIRGRGVANYRRDLAYDRFVLTPEEAHPRLERYIATLIGHGAQSGSRPVLGFNRSSLRIAWMRRRFGGLHLHIDREPRDIWASARRHMRDGNYFFFAGWLELVERNAGHPLFAPLAERLPLRITLRDRLVKPRLFYRQAAADMGLGLSYLLVFYLWRVSVLFALAHSDRIFDYSRAGEPGYADRFCDTVREQCGLEISLEGLRPGRSDPLALCNEAMIERTADQLLPKAALAPFVDRRRAAARLQELAPAKASRLWDAL